MTLAMLGVMLLLAWPVHHAILVVCGIRGTRPGDRRHPMTGPPPGQFWIMVPCLNEERVVERTVRSALALGSAQTPVRVLAIDDGSDDRTPQVLASISDPRLVVLRRELPQARLGKGRALNAGLALIAAEVEAAGLDPEQVVVGIIDGDGRGAAGMLEEIASFFRTPSVGAVQCRVRIHNRRHPLGALQDLEFACVANACQVLRDAVGSVGLGGNGQFARLSALRGLGDEPWSRCLVEDLELGLRLHLAGVGIRYASRASITQQGLTDVRRLVRQRTRWAQGNLQCIGHIPAVLGSRKIKNGAMLEMIHYLLAPWLNGLGTVGLAAIWAYVLVRGDAADAVEGSSVAGTVALVTAIWLALLTLPSLLWAFMHRILLGDERLWRCLVAGAAYPLYLGVGLASTWRAMGRHLSGRSGWTKTERLVEEPELVSTT